ncbi:hypothetical protein ACVXZY_09595 [Staphylococcus aureus]
MKRKSYSAMMNTKLELIDAIPEDENVTLYSQGDFTDLCRGVHVPSNS